MVAQRIGMPVLTEDTSFHVDAMDGQPGVEAGRYLTTHGREAILAALEGQTNRTAQIISAAAWATPEGDTQTWVTARIGVIAPTEKWQRGLPEWVAPTAQNPLGGGFNAIFIPETESRTLAEIPAYEAMIVGYREPNFSAALNFMLARANL